MADEKHLEILRQGVEVWNQWRKDNPETIPDLRNIYRNIYLSQHQPNLRGADFSGASLYGAYLVLANLSYAKLEGANLEGADLKGAHLSDADLKGANLKGADLEGANLSDAHLEGANLSGAHLYGANLKGVDLIRAKLKSANLEGANLEGVNLKGANLEGANLEGANLEGFNLEGVNLEGANLKGVSLESANLEGVNLKGVNLEGANLKGVSLNDFNLESFNLKGTNLMRVQALATNFEGAILTGACIKDWNINSQTNLQNVKCDYIYLKGIYSEEDKLIFSDRIPHDPNKNFAPGEFTKLFQKALETVDLIFSEGIEWAAFLDSFLQLQEEVKSDELAIQAIEKKSGGAFVVRLEVPEEANKAEIEKYIKQEYNAKLKVIEANYQKQLQLKDETIEAKNETIQELRQKGTDMLEMARIMSSFQQNTIIHNSPNMYNQSGEFGIGHNQGNISGNAKVAGEINEARRQDED